MKICPVKNNNFTFKNIVKIDPKAPSELFSEYLNEFQILSDAKSINIVPLRNMAGCMVRRETGYIVLMQGKDGAVVKEFRCSDKKEDMNDLNQKMEKYLLWANPDMNFYTATMLESSSFARENPFHTADLVKQLCDIASSPEISSWKAKIDHIV